jgi:hypothetical protein
MGSTRIYFLDLLNQIADQSCLSNALNFGPLSAKTPCTRDTPATGSPSSKHPIQPPPLEERTTVHGSSMPFTALTGNGHESMVLQ